MFLFWLTVLAAFTLSALTKFLADMFLHERVALLGSFLGLLPLHNPGVAFGVQLPSLLQPLIILLALSFVGFLALRSDRSNGVQFAFGLIVGGAIANLVDRLFDGVVTDFVQVGSFPVFNVADSCITIGVCLLLLLQLRKPRSEDK